MRFFTTWHVLDFSHPAFQQFEALRQQRVRTGTQDLRVAAITLAAGATLVTRNGRDLGQVPGLAVEDWAG